MIQHEELFLSAYKIRKIEQSLLALFSKGQISGTIHTCIGQELTGLSIAKNLTHEDDIIISNHRCHGHYLARFNDVKGLIGELLGKPSGVCKGFGGSQHIHRKGFFSSGIQGGMAPTAFGTALSRKYHSSEGIVTLFIGDGTLGQGILYETLNLASKHNAPLLFVLEDNGYAQSTKQDETLSGSIPGRAAAFNIHYLHASTFDIDSLFKNAAEAVRYVRNSCKPILFHINTFRLAPHSKGDDFRSPSELQIANQKDLLNIFLQKNKNDSKIQNLLKTIDEEIALCIQTVLQESNSMSIPPAQREYASLSLENFEELKSVPSHGDHAKDINAALHTSFEENPRLIYLGEDVRDPYGGTFKATKGLYEKYPTRVLNMPISEASIVGTALGLALHGNPTVCEIMFGDFITIAFDQILNHVAKLPFMYQKNLPAPLVIRTPMGGGRGYGSTHSQCLAKYLFGIPNLDVFLFHGRTDTKKFYLDLLRNLTRPTIVLENKLLYGSSVQTSLPNDYALFSNSEPFAMQRLCISNNKQSDITVVCFGGISSKLEAVANTLTAEEVYLDIFLPVCISKFDVMPIIESCQSTQKLVLLEEDTAVGNLSSELAKQLAIQWHHVSTQPFPKVKCIAARDIPIPAARYLEDQALPTVDSIKTSLLEFFYE